MTETDPEKRLIGYACISTYGQMLDTQLFRTHLRRRRRSGIGRLTDPTAAAQLWLRAGSSCPSADQAKASQKPESGRSFAIYDAQVATLGSCCNCTAPCNSKSTGFVRNCAALYSLEQRRRSSPPSGGSVALIPTVLRQ